MYVIAAIVLSQHTVRMLGILNGLVEIHHTIEGAARSDPVIYLFPLHFLLRSEVAACPCAFKRSQGGAKDFEAMLMGALDQLLQSPDDLASGNGLGFGCRRSSMPNVIDPFEHDHVFDTGFRNDIPAEARKRIRTEGHIP